MTIYDREAYKGSPVTGTTQRGELHKLQDATYSTMWTMFLETLTARINLLNQNSGNTIILRYGNTWPGSYQNDVIQTPIMGTWGFRDINDVATDLTDHKIKPERTMRAVKMDLTTQAMAWQDNAYSREGRDPGPHKAMAAQAEADSLIKTINDTAVAALLGVLQKTTPETASSNIINITGEADPLLNREVFYTRALLDRYKTSRGLYTNAIMHTNALQQIGEGMLTEGAGSDSAFQIIRSDGGLIPAGSIGGVNLYENENSALFAVTTPGLEELYTAICRPGVVEIVLEQPAFHTYEDNMKVNPVTKTRFLTEATIKVWGHSWAGGESPNLAAIGTPGNWSQLMLQDTNVPGVLIQHDYGIRAVGA